MRLPAPSSWFAEADFARVAVTNSADLSAVARLIRASVGETCRSVSEGGKVGTTYELHWPPHGTAECEAGQG